MESFELDVILNNARPALGISGFGASSANLGSRSIKEATLMANASAADEAITRIDREMKDDVRILLRAIEHRDHILSASRRAFQKLHRECKTVAHLTLLKIAEKEAEQAEQRRIVLDKMYRSVNAVDIDGDENEFIETHSGRDGALVLSAQALSLLGDLVHPPPVLDAMDGSSHGPARSNSVVAAGTAGPGEGEGGGYGRAGRDRSPHSQVRSRGSLSSSSDSSSRSPPSSPAMSKGRPSATSATGTPSSSNSSSSSASASAAAATTPSSSLPSSRFSFRRTLGLTSDSSHVISAPIVTTPTPAAASASVVVAAGKVGGEWAPAGPLKPTVGGAIGSGVSSAGNSGGGGGGGSGSAPPPTADFTAYLSQIFYTPGVQGTSNQKVCKETEASKRSTVPSASSAVSLAASNSSSRNSSNNRLEGTPADDKSSSIPTTPKVLIDDNYFCNGNAPGDVSKDVRQESLSFAKTPPIDDSSVDSPDTSSRKTANRNTKVTKSDLHCGALDWLRSNPHSYLIDAVEGISRAIKTQAGRNAFTTELNQFRSQKVFYVKSVYCMSYICVFVVVW